MKSRYLTGFLHLKEDWAVLSHATHASSALHFVFKQSAGAGLQNLTEYEGGVTRYTLAMNSLEKEVARVLPDPTPGGTIKGSFHALPLPTASPGSYQCTLQCAHFLACSHRWTVSPRGRFTHILNCSSSLALHRVTFKITFL